MKKWSDPNCEFRIAIKVKGRKYLPMHYYANSKHEAICLKLLLEQMLSDNSNVISFAIK